MNEKIQVQQVIEGLNNVINKLSEYKDVTCEQSRGHLSLNCSIDDVDFSTVIPRVCFGCLMHKIRGSSHHYLDYELGAEKFADMLGFATIKGLISFLEKHQMVKGSSYCNPFMSTSAAFHTSKVCISYVIKVSYIITVLKRYRNRLKKELALSSVG